MAHQRRLSDLPDFLENSPFIPFSTTSTEINTPSKIQPRPTLLQILRSKRFRTILIALFLIAAVYIIPSQLRSYHPLSRLGISGPKCYFSEPVTTPTVPLQEVNWSQYAYTQYATNADYLCNSLMIFESLHRLGSKADRVLLFPSTFLKTSMYSDETHLLEIAQSEFNVKLVPITEQKKTHVNRIWASSYTKLLAFNQTQYRKVIHLDSDSTLLANIDALFFLPFQTGDPGVSGLDREAIYVPRAYWLPTPKLGSHIMLIQPSTSTFEKIQKRIEDATMGVYDMEIVNQVFGNTCSLLPVNEYALLTGEFRSSDHRAFLGGEEGEWDPEKVKKNAKSVHFSDYPFPKPWEKSTEEQQDQAAPKCEVVGEGREDCRARDIWVELYTDFKMRRKTAYLRF